jgi:prephenate dehydratase
MIGWRGDEKEYIMKIAYLGPEGSYSHLAAQQFLSGETLANNGLDECVPFRNFAEVLNAVASGKADAGAIPIENSLQGSVAQNLDLMQAAEQLYAVKEYVLRIDHRLAYKEGTPLSRIGRVYSHRQALAQCSEFLTKHMPFAALRETESTAFGLTKAMEDESGKSAAIVGSHVEYLREGFVISDECLSDEKNNYTHFLLIKKGVDKLPKESNRLFFSAVCPNRPGSLLELLTIIAEHKIDMTKLESRPVKNRPGDFRFFIEANCNVADEAVANCIEEIKRNTLECKILGAYTHE